MLVLCGCQNTIQDSASTLNYQEPSENEAVFFTEEKGKVSSGLEDSSQQKIFVNMSGYEKTDRKIAVFRNIKTEDTFDVINADTQDVAFSGYIQGSKENKKSNLIC